MINFKNKNILITGASGGIGNELVKKFVTLGGNVLGCGTKAEKLDQIKKKFPTIKVKKFDMAEHSRIEEFIEDLFLELGGLDILINNAGTNMDNLSLRMKVEEWKRVIDVNLTGPFLCSQACAPAMIKQGGGCIVNITSISGLRASTLRDAYGTSKAGLMHLTKQQAAELGEVGIRVNAVSPGPVDTAMAKAVHSPAIRADYHDAIPLNRYGLEHEIADVIWFLCSDRSSYITGQTLAVDGGFDATGIGLPSLRGNL